MLSGNRWKSCAASPPHRVNDFVKSSDDTSLPHFEPEMCSLSFMTYIEVSIGRLWVGLNGLVGLKARKNTAQGKRSAALGKSTHMNSSPERAEQPTRSD